MDDGNECEEERKVGRWMEMEEKDQGGGRDRLFAEKGGVELRRMEGRMVCLYQFI